MHLFSNEPAQPFKVEKPCVRIQTFIENPDGSSTVGEYVTPPSVGTIEDFSVENLQNAGISVNEINDAYLHQSFTEMDNLLSVGASKLVSEAEVKEINSLE